MKGFTNVTNSPRYLFQLEDGTFTNPIHVYIIFEETFSSFVLTHLQFLLLLRTCHKQCLKWQKTCNGLEFSTPEEFTAHKGSPHTYALRPCPHIRFYLKTGTHKKTQNTEQSGTVSRTWLVPASRFPLPASRPFCSGYHLVVFFLVQSIIKCCIFFYFFQFPWGSQSLPAISSLLARTTRDILVSLRTRSRQPGATFVSAVFKLYTDPKRGRV